MTSYSAQPVPEPWAAGSPSRSDGRDSPDDAGAGLPPGDVRAPRADGHGQDRAPEAADGWPGGQIWERIGDDWEQADDGWGWPAADPRPGPALPSPWVPADRAEVPENGVPELAGPAGHPWLRPVGTDRDVLGVWDGPERQRQPSGLAAIAVPDALSPIGEDAKRWAMLSYLGVPFLNLVLPLCIYLATRQAPFVRMHAAQALNLAITVLLYNISALIFGGLLALDEIAVAVGIVAPLLTGLWLTALIYLVRAAVAAGRGEYREIPGWLCATITH